jgi:hypothetical protein
VGIIVSARRPTGRSRPAPIERWGGDRRHLLVTARADHGDILIKAGKNPNTQGLAPVCARRDGDGHSEAAAAAGCRRWSSSPGYRMA